MRGSPFASGGTGGGGTVTVSDILALGLTPTQLGAVDYSDGGKEKMAASASVSGTYTPDLSAGNHFVLTLTGDTTLNMPTISAGYLIAFTVRVITNGHSLSYDAKVTFASGTPGTLAAIELFGFFSEGDNTAWFGLHNTGTVAVGSNFVEFTATAEPAVPASGKIRLWFDQTLQKFLWKNSAGTIKDLGSTTLSTSGSISQLTGQLVTGINNTAAGTYSRTLAATPTNGNLLVAVFATDKVGSTIGLPSGWSTAIEYAGTQNIGKVGIYYKIAGASEPATATFTFTGGTGLAVMSFAEYTGNTATPLDKTASAEAHATSVTVTTAATTVANELAVCGFLTGENYGGSGAVAWGASGFATTYDSGNGGSGSKPLSATGAVSAIPTIATSVHLSGVVATFKAA